MLSQDPLHTFPGNFPIRPRRGRLPTGKRIMEFGHYYTRSAVVLLGVYKPGFDPHKAT